MIAAGYKTRAAFGREARLSAYGEAVTVSRMLPLLRESMASGHGREITDEARHGAGPGRSVALAENHGGGISVAGVYLGLEALLACAMGEAATSEVASGVFRHLLSPADCLHAESGLVRRGTLCLDSGDGIREYASAMVQSMTISGNSKGVVIDLSLLARAMDRQSAVNPSGEAWAIPGGDFRPLFWPDFSCRIGPWSATVALDEGDAAGLTGFSLELDNRLAATRDSLSGLMIAEPRREGKRRLTGKLSLPRQEDSSALRDAVADQTPLMARLLFTGPEIGATGFFRSIAIWLPRLYLLSLAAQASGPGLIRPEYALLAETPEALPAGFPAEAEQEILIEIINEHPTNPLLED